MDRNDDAIRAVQQTMSAIIGSVGEDDCASIVEAVVPFFPEALRRQCRVVSVRAGQVVFCRGKAEKNIHRLLRGDVSVQREIMGEGVTLQRAAPGDWLIEPQLCLPPTDAFALGERQSTLLAVPASALIESLDREPGFALVWCQELGAQIARMQRRIERISLRQAPQRIAHYLTTESPGGCGEMVLPYPKRVWAAHLGMAPETLSRTLTDLVNAGWLKKLPGNRYRLLRSN